jgi:hypothetical protein
MLVATRLGISNQLFNLLFFSNFLLQLPKEYHVHLFESIPIIHHLVVIRKKIFWMIFFQLNNGLP